MAKLLPAASSSPRRLISSLSAFALGLGALQHRVGMAERIGQRAFERLWKRDVVGRSVAWAMGYSIGLG